MIIPFLDGFLSFSRVPVTWLLILLNVFFFFQTMGFARVCQNRMSPLYEDKNFLNTQGRIYKQYHSKKKASRLSSRLSRARDMELLGKLAFQDQYFLESALKKDWIGDRIAIADWRDQLFGFLSVRAYYPPVILGMLDFKKDFFSLISYQFYHDGMIHLFGNLLMILLVAGFLENRHRGSLVFLIYLTGGIFSAVLGSGGESGLPIVGASGSVSALLGFLMLVRWNEKTRLFYFVLPTKKTMGFIWIPTCYWVFWFFILDDMAGWMTQSSFHASGVSHLIHLSGFLTGGLMGVLYIYIFGQKFIPLTLPMDVRPEKPRLKKNENFNRININ